MADSLINASMHSLDNRFALDVQSLDSLKHRAARDPQAGLEAAARQFEAIFVQMMLKSMREAIPESGLLGSDQTRFYDDLMDKQWSQEIASRGIGLAEQLTAQLSDSVSGRKSGEL